MTKERNMDFNAGIIEKDTLKLFEPFITEDAMRNAIKDEDYVMIGLTSGNAACGAIGGQFDEERDDLFIVESFYILPEVRGQGGGSLLFDTLIRALHEADEEASVQLSFIEMDKDTEELTDFLLNKGYTEGKTDKSVYLIPAEDIFMDGYKEPEDTRASSEKPGHEWVSENVCKITGLRFPGGSDAAAALFTAVKDIPIDGKESVQFLIVLKNEDEKKALEKAFPEADDLYRFFYF